jgi:hypothetical protein
VKKREPFVQTTSLPVEIVEADLSRAEHQQAVLELVDAYAADPMGNGEPLTDEVRSSLVLKKRDLLRHSTKRLPDVRSSSQDHSDYRAAAAAPTAWGDYL